MKLQELNDADLRAISGGADSAANTGAGIALGTDSLLSIGYSYDDGRGRSYRSQLDIGKDIRLDLGALGSSFQS